MGLSFTEVRGGCGGAWIRRGAWGWVLGLGWGSPWNRQLLTSFPAAAAEKVRKASILYSGNGPKFKTYWAMLILRPPNITVLFHPAVGPDFWLERRARERGRPELEKTNLQDACQYLFLSWGLGAVAKSPGWLNIDHHLLLTLNGPLSCPHCQQLET